MLEDYFFTKNTKWVLWGAVATILALLIFHAGVVTGSHQSERGRFLIEGGHGGGMFGMMPQQGFVDRGHGAVGTIATVTLPTFSMQTRDGISEIVETGSSTVVTGGRLGTLQDLAKGTVVIVIGDPKEVDADNNDLDARIIHILPSQPTQGTMLYVQPQ